jgi:uncharacterized membrane protein
MTPSGTAGARLKAEVVRSPAAWIYLVVALCWGVALVVLMPPFQNNDEPEHYFSSWALAEGQALPGSDSLVDLPANVGTLNADLRSTQVTQGAEPYDVEVTAEALDDEVSARRMRQFTSTGGYTPIGYLPQAVGIDVVRVLGGSPLLGLYAARLAVLLTSVAITFIALRLTPYGAAVLALVALLPMSVSLTASTNPGAFVNAGALLFLVLVLRLAGRGRVFWRDTAVLVAVALVFLTLKPGYAPLAALVFLLPPRVFVERRQYWTTITACVLGAFAISALSVGIAPDVSTARQIARGAPEGLDEGGQVQFVLAHPWAFLKVLYGTLGESGLTWLREAVGVLGRGAVVLSVVVTPTVLVGAGLLTMRGTDERVSLRPWQRLLLAGVGLLVSGVVVAALYVSWSPLASRLVLGVQGRYFLPVLSCFVISVFGWRAVSRRALLVILAVSVAVMVVATLFAVIGHYY